MKEEDHPAVFRPADLIALDEAEELGRPERAQLDLRVPANECRPEFPWRSGRVGEVVMCLPRPDGLLFHTKAFYPPGILRLPTGGIQTGEPILHAARREVREETGLHLQPSRFLFHLLWRIRSGREERLFHSLAFLYQPSVAAVVPEDQTEEITEFTPRTWQHIPPVIERLEGLADRWKIWGRFRAEPHRLLLRVRRDHPDWFS